MNPLADIPGALDLNSPKFFWLYCPACLKAWPVGVIAHTSEKEWVASYQPTCRWRCPDVSGAPPYAPVLAQRTPVRIRDALQAAYLLGGDEATKPVVQGWIAQVTGEEPRDG